MVKMRWFLGIVLLVCVQLNAAPSMYLELPEKGAAIDQPVRVKIHVIHAPDEKIDENSFLLEGKPVSFKQLSVTPEKGKLHTVFQGEVPGLPAGVQLVPLIKVNVAGTTIAAPRQTIQVGDVNAPRPKETPFMVMEVIFTGDDPLYPGQRAWIGYKIQFNRSIDLAVEELPLLSPEGFKKLGELQIRDQEVNGVTTRQILQRVEAVTPGNYLFKKSVIQGFMYKEGPGGVKQYLRPALQAEVNPVQMVISAFPEKEKPSSFEGAVGSFKIQSTLAGPAEVSVGDPLKVRLEISGKGEFETLQLPDFCCQPGFSGQFRLSDLAPEVDTKEDRKIFLIDFFPLSGFLKAFPPIFFTFFGPSKNSYQTITTDSLPIDVRETWPELPVKAPRDVLKAEDAGKSYSRVLPGLSFYTLLLSWWDGWHLLLFIPLLGALVGMAFWLKFKKPQQTAEELLNRAFDQREKEQFFPLLQKALERAVEEGFVVDDQKYRAISLKIERRIYSQDHSWNAKQALTEVEALWAK
jgi:hypothetical protein